MICRKQNMFFLVLIFFEILLLNAQVVPNTSSNQGDPPSSAQTRLFDPSAMGLPNFGSGRFGNPTSNYPSNSYSPFGNQNNNIQRPRPDVGSQNPNPSQGNFPNRPVQGGFPDQQGGFPDQQGYPYQGGSMNRYPNYQRPPYPNRPHDAYPNQNQGNFQNQPNQGGYSNQDGYPYQGDSMNPYPNYQRPPYPNTPNDASMFPGNINRPYQNDGMPSNQDENFNGPMIGQQYPTQGNFQNMPNLRPDEINHNFRPDDLNNFPETSIHFPGNYRPYPNQPNQYYPQTDLPNQNNPNPNFTPGLEQPTDYQSYPSNYIPDNKLYFPTNAQGVNGEQAIQFPDSTYPGVSVTVLPGASPNLGNFNNVPNQPQLTNNQGTDKNDNGTVAILGKPVILPPTTATLGQVAFDSSTESATQKQCVQDCPSTSEYDPVCGTNNVTYINPGKFICARNCGVVVYLRENGRCAGDAASI